ncbi:fumarylacetoacetate hydrolase family protein [Pseudomonas sp. Irchel s3b5]|uniref:fumarylacetoacetate hydrolase family protein n=1 Tax=Pseudomonas sp. Irchel s3b5 TaxID=2009077 RepID=UPI000BA44763|nr:fumarylacetoacetate hydrolase family protein [Pseudomonas sp. Irchel s3b5]
MKLGRISVDGPDGATPRLVLVVPEEQRVIDLRRTLLWELEQEGASYDSALRYAEGVFPGSMSAAIGLGNSFTQVAERINKSRPDRYSLPFDKVTWLPSSDPSVVRDGLTFVGHIKGFHEKIGHAPNPCLLQIPGYFKGTPHTVIGHEAEVAWPGYIQHMDYELELGYVIGRQARNLHPDNALDHLFGITIFNDFSARDRQAIEMPIGMGPTKCKDFAYGIGPWITTVDEFADLDRIGMEVRVNGEVWGKGDSSNKLWTIAELLAWASLGEVLVPGDVIGSGTMGGGSALELDRKLQPGDVVELIVEGVGTLRNKMGQPQEGIWWPEERKPFM